MAGGLGRCLVKIGKARTPGVIWSATILTATVMMLGLHYGEYVRELVAEDAQFHGVLRKGLTDVQSFLHFVDRKAQDGVRIGRRGKHTNLGYVGSYIYWFVEIGVAGGAVFLVLRKAADAPLCAVCQRWKEERELGMMSDMLSDKPPHLVASMLVEGNLLALMEQAKSHCSEGLLLKAAVCPCCGAETTVEVTLEHVTQSAKRRKQTRRLERVCYPGDVLPFLDARGGLA
jgi:hypothetical protein